MRRIRNLILAGISLAGLIAPSTAVAETNTPPPVVLVPPGGQSPNGGMKGAPPQIQGLIINFDATRDKYLAQQDLLLISLKKATPTEREQIRAQLQHNRDAFLAALQSFRGHLLDELSALKGKISHEEFLRIIDAAHDAATEGGFNHHKGH